MTRKINRWDLLPAGKAAGRALKETNVATNRRESDKYHNPKGLKSLLPGGGKGRGGPLRTARRLARRSNNGNIPGHGVGGVPGNGIGGGIPSFGLGHLMKNHHHMTKINYRGPKSGTAPAINAPGLKKAPMFKPVKPLPVRKPPKPFGSNQKKPQTSTPLGPLKSAATTAPKFAQKNTGGLPLRTAGRRSLK
jgi:hypothetical protein